MLIQGDEKLKTAQRKYLSFDTLSKIARKTRFCRTHAYMIDEMPIYLKALENQGLFRILGAKNIFHFYGCEIPTSETRTCDFIEIVEKVIIK